MSNMSLKNKVFSNLIWRFMERILAQSITTIVTIVLARILMPSDYGAVAVITVFINICNILISNGFNTALVQKPDVDQIDYSTIFFINVVITLILYLVLFFMSPIIAAFYQMPILSALLRVMGLTLPCTAINSVQNAYVSRRFQFKKYFFATLFGTIISATIGIYMALTGFGAWALCGQYLSSAWINMLTLWFTVKWRPQLCFSLTRAKKLFSYGWKILASSLLEELNIELKGLAIGKVYSSEDLAFYNRGKQFPILLNNNVNESVSVVLFPAMVEVQDNSDRMRYCFMRAIKTATFIMFPLQIGMALVAEPITRILLTEKWIESVPYMQIMCICFCFTPLLTTNSQVLKASGVSGRYLIASVFSNIFGIIIMLAALPFGVIYVALSGLISTVFNVSMVSLPNYKLYQYGLIRQLRDLLPTILLVSFMALATFIVGVILKSIPIFFSSPYSNWIILVSQIVVGATSYIFGAIISHNESFDYTKNLIKSFITRKREK